MSSATPYQTLCPLRLPLRSLRLRKEPHWQKEATRHDLKADLMYQLKLKVRAQDKNIYPKELNIG